MKLIEAIEFAVTRPQFEHYMETHGVNRNNIRKLTAKIVSSGDSHFVAQYIYADFGQEGPNLGEVRVSVRYDRQNDDFIFDALDTAGH
jgi:hypothetical protein